MERKVRKQHAQLNGAKEFSWPQSMWSEFFFASNKNQFMCEHGNEFTK